MDEQHETRRLSMKDLVELSSTHRQTIHSYLRQGVLPAPTEGAGTRHARYGQQHLALLRLVRELRDRGMSLNAIRRCFQQASFDPVRARGVVSTPSSDLTFAGGETIDAATLAAEAGCPPAWIDMLIKAGILRRGRIDRRIVSAVAASRALLRDGLPESAVLRVGRLAQNIAALESFALVSSVVLGVDSADAALRRAAERHAHVSELVSGIRSEGVRQAMRRMTQVELRSRTFAQDAIHVPSRLFVERHGLDQSVAQLEQLALQPHPDPTLWKRLGQVLLGLGRYDEAELWLGRSASVAPDDPATHSYLGLAKAMSGCWNAGIESAERAVELAPTSSRARAFLGAALALSATAETEATEAAETLRLAVRTAAESRAYEAPDLVERMETLLARGRLLTVLPYDLPEHHGGVADLEEVLERTDHGADVGFALAGSTELYRIHALFYLGLSAWHSGDVKRVTRFLQECITIDPASRFARRSYEILGQIDEQVEDGRHD